MSSSALGFFEAHSWLVLVGLALFPRVTLLFVGGPFGLLSWLGWAIAPHLLVAIIGTGLYWQSNPALCVFAWCFALAGTGGEGKAAHWGLRGHLGGSLELESRPNPSPARSITMK